MLNYFLKIVLISCFISYIHSMSVDALVKAVQQNRPDQVALLVPAVNVNGCNKAGITPLFAAVNNDNIPIIKILLDHKADPDIKSGTRGITALEWACKRDNKEIIELLKTNRQAVLKEKQNKLAAAVLASNKTEIAALVSEAVDINYVNEHKDTLLTIAASTGDLDTIKLLLDAKANPNVVNAYGVTPLMQAADKNNVPLVKVLLTSGANKKLSDKTGSTALDRAREKNNNLLVELLALSKDDINPHVLAEAVRCSDSERVKCLLELNINPNIKSKSGVSPLTLALLKGDKEIIHLLLKHPEIAINEQDELGNTPLLTAISLGKQEVVELLIGASADIWHENIVHHTAFTLAVKHKNTLISKLLEKVQNNEPLIAAILTGTEHEVEHILNSPHVKTSCAFMRYALYKAIQVGFAEKDSKKAELILKYSFPKITAKEIIQWYSELSYDCSDEELVAFIDTVVKKFKRHRARAQYLQEHQ